MGFVAYMIFQFAFAETVAKPACTAKEVFDDCRIFRERVAQPEITLPDGTSIENPLHRPSSNLSSESIAIRARIFSIWSEAPRADSLRDEFKVSFNRHLNSKVLQAWANGDVKNIGNSKIQIFWPPEGDDGSPREIPARELVRYLDRLPLDVKGKLAGQIKAAGPVVQAAHVSRKNPAKITPVQLKRVTEAFEFARTALIETVLRGRRPEALSPQEYSQYQRFLTIRLIPPEQSAANPECVGRWTPASYEGKDHAVLICPEVYNAPVSSLVMSLGHEIGHSVDPCCGRSHLFAINHDKIESHLAKNSARGPGLDAGTNHALETLTATRGKYAIAEFQFETDGPQLERGLRKSGFVEVAAQRFETEESDPQYDLNQCLLRTTNLYVPPDSDLEKFAKDFSLDKKENRKTMLARLGELRHCLDFPGGKSQLPEASSDVWGARALGQWLQKNPPTTDEEKLAALHDFVGASCRPREPIRIASSAMRSRGNQKSRHPEDLVRLDRIILTEPSIQRALGCEGDKNLNCLQGSGGGGDGDGKSSGATEAVR